MDRILKFSFLLVLLSACAKSPGFKASEYTYIRVAADSKPAEKTQAPVVVPSADAPKPGTVVRNSNKITFTPVQSDSKWDPKNVHMKAKVQVGDKSYGEVEFQGQMKDSKILLNPVDPALKDQLKAQMICTTEDDSCTDSFIEVFFRENDVVYHDQIIPKAKEDPTQTEKAKAPVEDSQKAQNPNRNDQSKAGQPSKTDTQNAKQPEKKDPVKTEKQSKEKQPKTKDQSKTPAPAKAKEEKQEKVISDGYGTDDVESYSYVGSSDEEIRQIFHIEEPKETTPSTTSTTTTTTTSTTSTSTTTTTTTTVRQPQPSTPKTAKVNPTPKRAEEPKPVKPQTPTPTPTPSKPPEKQNVETDKEKKDNADSSGSNETGNKTFENLRVHDQVIGSPTAGRLNNGTDFLKLSGFPGFYFYITNPNGRSYFGAFDMAVVIKKIGEALQTLMPGRKLAITSISKWGGGRLAPHEGHQNGTDADIRYLTNNEAPGSVVSRGHVTTNLLVSQQWKLLKMTFATNMVDVVFVDSAVKKAMCEEARRVQDYTNGDNDSNGAEVLKRLQTWSGHDDHFHVRIRCSSDNPRCKRIQMVFKSVGC